ncbi:unnamed protein product [Trichobilharzia szidati]|nr:unnamed protein product [Trichobilharzia szidati]
MGWLQRLSKKKHSENENYEVQKPKKSILRSTSRATSNPSTFEEEEYDNDAGETDLSTSVSLVNLRSTSPEVRRRLNSTNRLSAYPPSMNGNHSDSENNDQTLNRRTVLFLDQVAAPDRNRRTSRTLMNIPSESANRNYATYSGHRSPPTFSRTISPSSASSLASYPANYEPSPLIRKKTFDDPGIELVSCTPLPYSTTLSQPEQPTSKLQKLKSARKHLPNLNAFHKKRKDTRKPGKFLFLVNQESDGINKDMYFYENNINELDQENNNNNGIYEELQRLESNDESIHGWKATLISNRITTPIKIDRQNPDTHHVGNDYQLNQFRGVTAKNSSQTRQHDKTPTGSTETLVSMSRQLPSDNRAYYDMPPIYRNGQVTRVRLPEFSSNTPRNPEISTDRIIDRSQSQAMKAPNSPTQKYNITSVNDTSNNDTTNTTTSTTTKNNNNNSHAVNSQSPRIIYVSKQHSITPDLGSNAPTVNRNRIISISSMSEPSTPRMYSVYTGHKTERTYTNNQYNYNTTAPVPPSTRKGSVSIIHYDTTNNHNDSSDDDHNSRREYNL